jgi:tetratricopeptide (TPR) repeat protein
MKNYGKNINHSLNHENMKSFMQFIKPVFFMLFLLYLTCTVSGQNKEEKQPAQKGLGSKLKQIKLPEGIGPKIPGVRKIFSEGNEQEESDQQSSEDEDTEEERFDEDEEDADKMMEKMIRQLGHDPEKVKQMMNEEGADADPRAIPEPDQKVLASLKPTPRNEIELENYLKSFDSGADQALSPEAGKHVSPHLNKGQQTKEVAYMLWMTGQQEAAAYLMLKAAIADPEDELLLSNLCSVITMAGYADKSIPLLDYLKNKNPQSSIINNNLGQAWLSLGQVAKAKPLLEQAVGVYDQHPEANRSLARIAQKEGNVAQAKAYLNNSLKGGFSQEAYYELKDMNANLSVDIMEIFRLNHKRFYKGIAITKRFTMPSVPTTINHAINQEQAIEDFFNGIELTIANINSQIPPATDKIFEKQQKVSFQMAAISKRLTSMEDVKKQYELFAQVWNPFKLQAQEMLMAELDDSYATSFTKRIKQLTDSREMKMQELNSSLRADERKILEMEQRLSKMETGEGESPAVQALEIQICLAKKRLNEIQIELSSTINNAFVHEMESLAFQRLQEQTYWYTLYFLPQDPTDFNYHLYAEYLSTLARMKSNYPYPVPPPYTGNGCDIKLLELVTPNGKMSKWEETNCATYWDLDFHLVKSKFTCKEVTITAKVYGVEFGGGQKYDPTTLETIEHSIVFGGKIGKSSETVGKALAANVSAGAVTTVKFDGNWNVIDIIVKVSAGAELGLHVPKSTDPNDSGLDIRQAASVGVTGGYELSILSGFRGTTPKVSSVGNIFNR